ncbi:polyamine aminopropyltransferase [Acaryochloris marina]|uniref:polyamine aminopropyltransferase n=1 Tax=Acaryochloris marina TaxID=155978 RepID=UPI001BB03A04|nr:polyamine aminopropyltransferase [Acaryochloris marina]QUY41541.1 polyamine aminopropyltransferase [Acaryochloris marina S15]
MPGSESTSVTQRPEPIPLSSRQQRWLLAAAAISSSVGLAAELLLGTLASYLVGNTALAYGVAVGGFLAAMGLGAYVSQFIAVDNQQRQLLKVFLQIELLIAPLTAILPIGLFVVFVADGPIWLGLFLVTLILGILSGLEVPILTRIIEQDRDVKFALAGVLALDYVGALVGSLAFPVLLLPLLGLFPTAVLIGSLPAFMVFRLGRLFRGMRSWSYWGLCIGVGLCVFSPFVIPFSDRLENTLYRAPIVSRIQSSYQRIVLTRSGNDTRLYLDGDLQLSTVDEYRYHEALVHPALSTNAQRRQVLVLGAGDGMALREILKWPEVEKVVLIELDPAVVKLARQYPVLVDRNARALDDPRVEVIFGDAFKLAPQLPDTFDVIIADFPDPDRPALAKLYSQGFYRKLLSRLAPEGIFVTQASSPFFAPKVMDCIATTLAATDLQVYPYTVNVPSFGPWGFVLASPKPVQFSAQSLTIPTRFLTPALLPELFQLPADISIGKAKINRLTDPVIVQYQADPRWSAYY